MHLRKIIVHVLRFQPRDPKTSSFLKRKRAPSLKLHILKRWHNNLKLQTTTTTKTNSTTTTTTTTTTPTPTSQKLMKTTSTIMYKCLFEAIELYLNWFVLLILSFNYRLYYPFTSTGNANDAFYGCTALINWSNCVCRFQR